MTLSQVPLQLSYSLPRGAWRLWGLPKVSSSAGWATPVLSTLCYRRGAPALWSSLQSSSALAPTGPCLPYVVVSELDTVLQGQPHLSEPADYDYFDAAWDTVGFLGCKYIFSGHVVPLVTQHPHVFLLRAVLDLFIPSSACIWSWDLPDPFVEPHTCPWT